MQKYVKKPVVVEAVQIKRESFDVLCSLENWGTGPQFRIRIDAGTGLLQGVTVDTLEGQMQGAVGDWVIRGVEGELYVCKDSIFQKTYDRLHTEKVL